MTRRSPSLSRRRFLRGAGGLLVGLPILSSLRASAQETSFPKRLVLVYNPNGTVQKSFWPTAVRSETDFDLGEILSPLAGYQDKLLLLKGLKLAVAQSAVGPGGPHQKGVGALFTGRELLSGEFRDGCGSQAGWANGISVDQEVAARIGTGTFLPSLELGVRAAKNDVQSRISYSGPAQPLPPMNSPRDVYFRLFSDLGAGEPSAAIGEVREKRRSVLDAVRGQFDTLSQRVSAEDRAKMDQHATLVRDVERRLDIVPGDGSCVAPPEPPELPADSEESMEQIAGLQTDLLGIALSCDLVRVASLQFSDGLNTIRFPWIESTQEGHALSHTGESNTSAQAQLVARHRWYVQQVARLVEQLSQIPEGDGSVLDNTLIVWGNEIGVGNTHTHENIPFLLVGSAGGALRTGRFIDYGGRSHADLLVSVLNAMGLEATSFGHPDFVTGPLPDLT